MQTIPENIIYYLYDDKDEKKNKTVFFYDNIPTETETTIDI